MAARRGGARSAGRATRPAAAGEAFAFEELVRAALAEDLRSGDVTSRALIPEGAVGEGVLLAKSPAVACALDVAALCFKALDEDATFEARVTEGARVRKGAVLARVRGRLRALLGAERTALNLVQRAMGIAAATRACVDAVRGTRVRILDTRKTAPLLRALDKRAVRAGGGTNHRFALDDMILVKDNHVAAVGSLATAVERALAAAGQALKVEVEVDSLAQLDEILALPRLPDVVLVDNFSPSEVRRAVRRVAGRMAVEVSGGVTLATLRRYAEARPDAISLGALTHSVQAADVSLEIASP